MGTDSSRSRRGWRDRVDRMRYPLDAPALVVAAIKQASCDDVVPGPIAEPLELLTRSLEREARLNRAGRLAARDLLVTRLAQRAQWLGRAHRPHDPPLTATGPAVIPRPAIVITGLPGSGAERIATALAGRPTNDPPVVESADEWVTALGLLSWRFDLWWHVPAYAEWLADTDGDAAYQLLADALAALPLPPTDSHARPKPGSVDSPAMPWRLAPNQPPRDTDGHPILVSPHHLAYLPTLRRHLPEALILRVNADPERTAQATAELASQSRSRWSDHVDHDVIRRYWAWRTRSITEQSFAQTPIGSDGVLDVTTDTPWTEIADTLAQWRTDSVR